MLDAVQLAVTLDPQDRDLVAAGISGEQVTAVAGFLQRPLSTDSGPGPGATGGERGAGDRREPPVGVAVKAGDRVGRGGVVVDIDVADDGGLPPRCADLPGNQPCGGTSGAAPCRARISQT